VNTYIRKGRTADVDVETVSHDENLPQIARDARIQTHICTHIHLVEKDYSSIRQGLTSNVGVEAVPYDENLSQVARETTNI